MSHFYGCQIFDLIVMDVASMVIKFNIQLPTPATYFGLNFFNEYWIVCTAIWVGTIPGPLFSNPSSSKTCISNSCHLRPRQDQIVVSFVDMDDTKVVNFRIAGFLLYHFIDAQRNIHVQVRNWLKQGLQVEWLTVVTTR
jgi:hypothetical protein